MASPFPGMDPFLENPALFHGLHNNFITYAQEYLQTRLPEPYYAQTGERVEISRRHIEPDLKVFRSEKEPTPGAAESSSVAVAEAVLAKPVVVTVLHDEHRETFIDIYAKQAGGDRLVTTMEVLSHSNKTPGTDGFGAYLRKQEEILKSKINLVEIDLLRGGQHATAVPADRAPGLKPEDLITTPVSIFSTNPTIFSFTPWCWNNDCPSSLCLCCRRTRPCRWTCKRYLNAVTKPARIGAGCAMRMKRESALLFLPPRWNGAVRFCGKKD